MKFLKEFTLFLISLMVAVKLKWGFTDLIWSFWTSSLIIGYITILYGAFQIAANIRKVLSSKQNRISKKSSNNTLQVNKGFLILISLVVPIFYTGFFTLHFGGFHLGHSVFLYSFAPLEGLIKPDMNHFMSFHMVGELLKNLSFLISQYWPIVLSAGVNEFYKLDKRNNLKLNLSKNIPKDKKEKSKVFMKPYANVIKIHLSIFIIFPLNKAGISGTMLFIPIFALFFFPFGAIFSKSKKKKIKRS